MPRGEGETWNSPARRARELRGAAEPGRAERGARPGRRGPAAMASCAAGGRPGAVSLRRAARPEPRPRRDRAGAPGGRGRRCRGAPEKEPGTDAPRSPLPRCRQRPLPCPRSDAAPQLPARAFSRRFPASAAPVRLPGSLGCGSAAPPQPRAGGGRVSPQVSWRSPPLRSAAVFVKGKFALWHGLLCV